MNDEPLNYQLTPHYVPIVQSNAPAPVRMYNSTDEVMHESVLELSGSEEDREDQAQTATTSLPARTQSTRAPRKKKPLADIQYQCSYELPTFSSQVMHALETNTIQNVWSTFMYELAIWVLSRQPVPKLKGEFQAIGQMIYKQYPCVGRDGFRPWSYMCRCLSQKLRRIVKKQSDEQTTIQ